MAEVQKDNEPTLAEISSKLDSIDRSESDFVTNRALIGYLLTVGGLFVAGLGGAAFIFGSMMDSKLENLRASIVLDVERDLDARFLTLDQTSASRLDRVDTALETLTAANAERSRFDDEVLRQISAISEEISVIRLQMRTGDDQPLLDGGVIEQVPTVLPTASQSFSSIDLLQAISALEERGIETQEWTAIGGLAAEVPWRQFYVDLPTLNEPTITSGLALFLPENDVVSSLLAQTSIESPIGDRFFGGLVYPVVLQEGVAPNIVEYRNDLGSIFSNVPGGEPLIVQEVGREFPLYIYSVETIEELYSLPAFAQ